MAGPVERGILGDAQLLVGRDRERELLDQHVSAALTSRGSVVLIGGEAGIGKTALATAVAISARARGALVATGHAYDLTDTPPYGPWFDLFARFPVTSKLRALSLEVARGHALARSQSAFFAEVHSCVADAADQQPLVLILDDLHWADTGSLDLLRFMARELGDLRVLLLVTYRADELTRHHPLYALIPRLAREARAERIDLKGLSDDDARSLVHAHYRLSDGDERRLAAYLQRRTDGNPFYIGEVLRALEEEDVIQRGTVCTIGDLEHARVPPLLRQVIDGRLARLQPSAGLQPRELLEVAAVIGQEVPLALWGALVGVADEGLITIVESAVDARILVSLPDGTSVRFVHALIREALYASILPPRCRIWHRRIAEELIVTPRPDPDMVAYHLQRAGDRRAGPWLVRAGERAQRTYAWLTAADRYEAALDLLDPVDAAMERGWLLCDLAWLRHFVDPEGSMAHLDEADRLARTLQDDALSAFAAFGRGFLHCRAGAISLGIAEMTNAWAALEALPLDQRARPPEVSDRGLLNEVTVGSALALWLAHVGRYAEARTLAEHLLNQAPATGSGLAQFAEALYALAHVAAMTGKPGMAAAYYHQAAEAFRAIDHYVYVAGTTIDIVRFVLLPYATTDIPERRRIMADSEAAMARTGGVYPQFGPRNAYLPSALLEGRWDEAADLATATQPGSPGSVLRSVRLPIRGWLAREQGDVAAAWTAVHEVHLDGPATMPGGYYCPAALSLQRLAATLMLDAHDPTSARDWIIAHDRWLAWSGALLGRADGHLLWAAYYREAGDADAARRHATEALQQASEPSQPLVLLVAHRFLGEIETAANRHIAAEAHLQQALELADACAAPFERALVLLASAALRHREGAREQARALLASVRAICEPLRARRVLDQEAALRAQLDASTPSGPLAELTSRELDVLREVARGATNARIAEQLCISPRTVDHHLRAIYGKLGVASRTAAARLALDNGLS